MTDTDIEIRIKAESAKASKDIASLNKQIAKMNKTIAEGGKVTEKNVGQMTRSFKSLTAHVSKLALIYGSFKTLMTATVITAKFEESIKKLGVFSGTSAEQLSELEDKAKELGESTVFSASQVAEGMNEMALAGLKSEEMLAGIGDVLNLAQVGMLDLKTASDFVVTSMKAFGLEATDIGDITDIMAKASTISATNVTQLGQALSKVGQVASAYNVSLAETASALGILADAGRRGTEAGTQLKIVMQRLAGNKEALKYLDELGISMYDANGQLKPFSEQLKIVKERLSSMSEKARNIKLSQIFGSEASASAIALTNNYDKMLEKLELIKQAMADDFAEKSAKEMVDTLIGSYKSLISALEGLAIKIMAELTPALREMLDGFTELVRGMDDEAIYDFAQSLGFLIESVTKVVSVMATLGGVAVDFFQDTKSMSLAIGGLILGIKLLGTTLRTTLVQMGALTALSNPVIAGLIAITAVLLTATDAMNNHARAIKKELDLQSERGKSFSKVVDAIVNATDKETGAIGRSNLERAKIASATAKVIASLIKEREALDENALGTEEYNRRLELLTDQIDSLDGKLIKIGSSWTKESKAIKEVIDKQIVLNEVTSDALKNYTNFETKAGKRYTAVAKVIDKLIAKEEKLKAKVQQLEQDKLNIIKSYADKRNQLNEDYDTLLYNARTKDLDDYQKYLSDKARASELLAKGDSALATGNIESAGRFYDEAKSMATSFANTQIKLGKDVVVSSKATYAEAEAIYKRTKEGEKAVLDSQQKAELSAHKEKMKLVAIELKSVQIQITAQEALSKSIVALAKVYAGKIGEFDNVKVFETAKAELASLIADVEGSDLSLKAKLDTGTVQDDLDAQIERMKKRTKPSFAYKLEPDQDSVDGAVEDIENTDVTTEMKVETDKDFMIRIQKQVDAETLKGDVDLEVEPQSVIEAQTSVKDTPFESDLDLNPEPALLTANDVASYVGSQVLVSTTDTNPTSAYAGINAVVAYGNRQKIVIPVYTKQMSATGGLIAPVQKLADGGTFTGSGRVQGYDPSDSDSVSAMLTGGEFVIKREAVDKAGLGLLHAINNMNVPKGFAEGGHVGGESKMSATSVLRPINLHIGNRSFNMFSDKDVSEALQRYIRNEGGL